MGIISALAPQICSKLKKKGHKALFFELIYTRKNILNQQRYFFQYHVDLNFSVLINDQHIPYQIDWKLTRIDLNRCWPCLTYKILKYQQDCKIQL